MKIIISPAKKMRDLRDEISGPVGGLTLPRFQKEAKLLQERLREMTFQELQRLWACNEQIARLNQERLRQFPLQADRLFQATPCLLSYEGIQYQYMAPQVFTREEWFYVNDHLRILSGFYGILAPLDGVVPYRLEMQAKLSVGEARNLYEFWGDKPLKALDDSWILNLASKEYSKLIEAHLTKEHTYISCTFGELMEGRVKVKGTLAKMARGEMVRYLARENITGLEGIKAFTGLGYRYSPEHSSETELVFLKNSQIGLQAAL